MKNLKTVLLVCLIIVVTFLAFLPCLKNGFVNWDDDAYIAEVTALQHLSFKNIKYIFTSFSVSLYQPLNRLSYLLEYNFFKLNPFVYHLTNLILHLFVCLSVFWLIFLFTRKISISSITAILFAVHPLRVESVAWVSDRQDIFCALFFLLAIISYCYYLRRKQIDRYYYFSLILFIFSLSSKAMAVTLPIVLFLVDYLFYRKPDKRMFLDKIPFFLLSFIFGVVTIIGKYLNGPVNSHVSIVLPNKVAVIVCSPIFYLSKLLLPIKLSCFYPYSMIEDFPFLYSLIILMALLMIVVASGRYTRKIVFGSAFFLVTIIPVLRFIPVSLALVADRYVYIPSVGLFYLAACGFVWLYKRGTKNISWIKLFLSFLLIIIVCNLSYLTWKRCQVWKDNIALWSDVLKNYPDVNEAYNNRGWAYHDQGNFDKAISDYSKAIELNPKDTSAYVNRGVTYSIKGNFDQAISDYSKAIKLDPNDANAYSNRGIANGTKDRLDQAIADFSKAIEINPAFASAYYNRGVIYFYKKNYDKAWDDVHKADSLGYEAELNFLNELKKVSGRGK